MKYPGQTITSDNGKEFAYHQHVSNALNTAFYFAKPYSAWQRGTNENTNGLVRYYLPKGTDFSNLTPKEPMDFAMTAYVLRFGVECS